MSLITAHRILIAAAILLALFYGGWELYGFAQRGETGALVRGAISILVAVAWARYFRTIGVRKDRQTGSDDRP